MSRKKTTKEKVDELMKLYDKPLPSLISYSHDLYEPREKKEEKTT